MQDEGSEDGSDEEEAGPASDPEDADIGLPSPAAAPAARNTAAEPAGGAEAPAAAGADAAAELVGGAADVDADDDAAVCASLFKVGGRAGEWQVTGSGHC